MPRHEVLRSRRHHPVRTKGLSVLSVGLLLYRLDSSSGSVHVLLAHMGGPFWAAKDDQAWTIPKGLREKGEDDLLEIAEREFAEEMGAPAPFAETLDLGSAKAGRKTNHVFARRSEFDAESIVSNTFELEWPPKSGQTQLFPEVDRAAWLSIKMARQKLVKGQLPFLDRLIEALG
jgi:predicted NUDIX family NTP pyrophosphohydrolase